MQPTRPADPSVPQPPGDDPMAGAVALGARLVTDVLDPLKQSFIGKDEVIDLMGVALAAGENLFLLGPPGTAKSALVSELGRRLHGNTFEYLLTRFTEPNELFGPFDIRRLREGELVTNTEGMLPEASLIFLDELLNANSAILNSLLMVLNERVFRRGRETRALPTLAVFAASNRLPEDEALGALFDRFLIRAMCENVPNDRLLDVLHAGWALDRVRANAGPGNGQHDSSVPAMDADHVRRLTGALGDVDLSAVVQPLATLVLRLRNAGLLFSDRRAVKAQKLVAASALLCGRSRAVVSDLWVFRHVWDTLEQREVLASLVQEALKAEGSGPRDHPRAAGNMPDPEALTRDIEALRQRLADGTAAPGEREAAKDRLTLLGGRLQWVPDAHRRQFLQKQIDAAWAQADGASNRPGTGERRPA
jgi:MoxR-like ATPase